MSAKDRADKLFSLCVRERAGYRCQRCGLACNANSGRLHCSHLVNGRRFSIRWFPDAAAAHCWLCHDYFGMYPKAIIIWRRAHLGKERARKIESLRSVSLHLNHDQIEDIYQKLKASYESMLAQRAAGESGWIDFPSPYPDGVR